MSSEIEYVSFSVTANVGFDWGPWYLDDGSVASLVAQRTVPPNAVTTPAPPNFTLRSLTKQALPNQEVVRLELCVPLDTRMVMFPHVFGWCLMNFCQTMQV